MYVYKLSVLILFFYFKEQCFTDFLFSSIYPYEIIMLSKINNKQTALALSTILYFYEPVQTK